MAKGSLDLGKGADFQEADAADPRKHRLPGLLSDFELNGLHGPGLYFGMRVDRTSNI